jgi:hypothetical protein
LHAMRLAHLIASSADREHPPSLSGRAI